MTDQTNAGTQSVGAAAGAPTQAPVTAASVLDGILAVVKADTTGAVVPLLQGFKDSVDASPSIEGAAAAGAKFQADAILALPAVAGTLIKDLTNLLVGDAISSLSSASGSTSNT